MYDKSMGNQKTFLASGSTELCTQKANSPEQSCQEKGKLAGQRISIKSISIGK